MNQPWKASQDILALIRDVQTRHHGPRLENACVTAAFRQSRAFVKNRMNLGTVTRFSPLAKLWQEVNYDFCIVLSSDLWQGVLNRRQQEALIDLSLTRCEVEYVPETIEENGKMKPLKDEWGRVKYTSEIKLDDEGRPKWTIEPLDLPVIVKNIRRYGFWMEDFDTLRDVISEGSVIDA